MDPYIIAFITVTCIAIILYLAKFSLPIWQYALLFFILAAFNLLSTCEAMRYDPPFHLDAVWEIEAFGHPVQQRKQLTDQDRKQYAEKALFHRREGDRTWKDAKEICWYLPSKRDRDRALDCFKVAAAGAIPEKPQAKMVGMVVTLLTQYGVDCMNAWNDLQTKLYWSEYHYTMYEFYTELSCTGKY